jgi:hypothetical protein
MIAALGETLHAPAEDFLIVVPGNAYRGKMNEASRLSDVPDGVLVGTLALAMDNRRRQGLARGRGALI